MAINVPLKKVRFFSSIYLLAAIPLFLVILFNYYPIFNGIVHIFYSWDGDAVEEFCGLDNLRKVCRDTDLLRSFGVVGIFIAANIVKMVIPIMAAVTLHHIANGRAAYVYKILFVIPMVVPAMVGMLIWKYFYEPTHGVLNEFLRTLGLIGPTETIQWLSNSMLVIPSLVFSGFPYVGAFGVLIYLAGLQNIPDDVYEAAEVDGAGPWTIFWTIELPLIMTQVRINLILMMIGTVQSWENVYLFVGASGGPDGIATVPGLLLYREAFGSGFFGYGCAVGFLLFLVTLILTYVNSRFIRTRK